MNPYELPVPETNPTDTRSSQLINPKLRFVSAAIGASLAALSLLVWTAAIIYYIDTTYHPNMGFWAVILLGLAVLAIPAVTFLVYRLSHCCSRRVQITPYCLAGVAVGFVLALAIPTIAWTQSSDLSVWLMYGVLAVLMIVPPCLLGFMLSGCVVWLGSRHGRDGEQARAPENASQAVWPIETFPRVPGDA